MKAHGLTRKRPRRRGADQILGHSTPLTEREIRSYEVEYVLQLVHMDFHRGSRKVITRAGERINPLLVAFIDDRSRYMAHAQWYTNQARSLGLHYAPLRFTLRRGAGNEPAGPQRAALAL